MRALKSLAAALVALPFTAPLAEKPPFEMEYPIACPEGQRCPVMVHVDHDPGPGIKDFACGTVTYDGHSGIDFRVEDLLAVAQGVPVLAAAPGVVSIIRDDVPDHNPFNYDQAEAARSSVCGNRVVLEHGPEWSTHYCHLRMGPAPVQVGQQVEAGQVLGYVGMSGSTNFPHFQLNLLHTPPGQRLDIDPFAPEGPSATCSADIANSAWSRAAQRQLTYEGPALANMGFADQAVTNRGIENGVYKRTPVEARSEALVLYARTIAIQRGDIQRLTILSPDGSVLSETETDAAERNRLQSFLFVGRRLRADRWPAGPYIGFYEVLRDGRVVLSAEETLYIP
ncbi:MAG: M23 family metallopeptidase [Pseudomonadota bacterium]